MSIDRPNDALPRAARGLLLLLPLILCLFATDARAQSAADSTAIRQAALDYIEGWYTGDAERMARAVHSKLAKRIFATHPKTGKQVFGNQDSTSLVRATKEGYGTKIPESKRRKDVTILDVFNSSCALQQDIDAAGEHEQEHFQFKAAV